VTPDEQAVERLRAAFAELAADAVPGADCPDPGRLWAALHGEGSAAERREVALHAIACPACAEAWRLARSLSGDATGQRERAAPHVFAPPAGRNVRWWAAAGLAASLLLAAGLALFSWRSRPVEPPVYRAQPGESIVSLVPDGAVLPRTRCLLRWSGPAGARYDLLVATSDMRPLVRVPRLEASEYLVAADALAALPAGARLLWQVEADLPGGSRLPSSTFSFTLD
jgi:anti-sigma factor ChrR (cupin superfamily)